MYTSNAIHGYEYLSVSSSRYDLEMKSHERQSGYEIRDEASQSTLKVPTRPPREAVLQPDYQRVVKFSS